MLNENVQQFIILYNYFTLVNKILMNVSALSWFRFSSAQRSKYKFTFRGQLPIPICSIYEHIRAIKILFYKWGVQRREGCGSASEAWWEADVLQIRVEYVAIVSVVGLYVLRLLWKYNIIIPKNLSNKIGGYRKNHSDICRYTYRYAFK